MNNQNFDALMREQIESLGGRRAKLLLHSCCAPCSSACIERLKDFFEITVFYFNPNIEEQEYFKRKDEQIRFLKQTGWADFLDCDHEGELFYDVCGALGEEKEGGARCLKCFELRLERTAQVAQKLGYEFFATTLTVSPQKNAAALNRIGLNAEQGKTVRWLYSDFKKRGGYLRSCELAKDFSLYRQDYCGCEFSHRQRLNQKSTTND